MKLTASNNAAVRFRLRCCIPPTSSDLREQMTGTSSGTSYSKTTQLTQNLLYAVDVGSNPAAVDSATGLTLRSFSNYRRHAFDDVLNSADFPVISPTQSFTRWSISRQGRPKLSNSCWPTPGRTLTAVSSPTSGRIVGHYKAQIDPAAPVTSKLAGPASGELGPITPRKSRSCLFAA
jgi:hypothetical protein